MLSVLTSGRITQKIRKKQIMANIITLNCLVIPRASPEKLTEAVAQFLEKFNNVKLLGKVQHGETNSCEVW
ncbi:uncharacterized protein OCT59_015338 [Rhizophagus irregularis]|uniref:uncharacterized protein n=1 Tax=Rhizophagus irregularis TaxID=588596 RepID=UPI00332B9948|nr:hypothetical protein OCT59_015338 [Rhizophagus irregularis]